MKTTTCVMIGVAGSALATLMLGACVWFVLSSEQAERDAEREYIRAKLIEAESESPLIITDRGPPVQPAGTVLMTVRIDSDDPAAQAVKPGYKVTVVAVTQSEKRKKEIVTPVAFNALVMEVDTSAMEANELTLSVAVPVEQAHLLSYAVDGGTTIRVQLPKCGGWVPHETDGQVFLAAATSTDELLAVLYGE